MYIYSSKSFFKKRKPKREEDLTAFCWKPLNGSLCSRSMRSRGFWETITHVGLNLRFILKEVDPLLTDVSSDHHRIKNKVKWFLC